MSSLTAPASEEKMRIVEMSRVVPAANSVGSLALQRQEAVWLPEQRCGLMGSCPQLCRLSGATTQRMDHHFVDAWLPSRAIT